MEAGTKSVLQCEVGESSAQQAVARLRDPAGETVMLVCAMENDGGFLHFLGVVPGENGPQFCSIREDDTYFDGELLVDHSGDFPGSGLPVDRLLAIPDLSDESIQKAAGAVRGMAV